MNAPEQINDAEYRLIPLDKLVASPTNPRKRFDQSKLQELAASIKVQGVLQPILVRTELKDDGHGAVENIGRFEIIAGERRWRAAVIAGLAEMPCTIRSLTDVQVLHAQVIENLQRDDLHPIEEAEGYERLLEQKDAEGNKYTVDTIAAEVGKSRAYVYARLKLLALCESGRDAFFKGELDASTALLIARIPVDSMQIKAVKEVLSGGYEDGVMSYRAARDHIHDNYMTELKSAPWTLKDADLHPKAGACADCAKRTGNQPGLFDDVKSKDVCIDTACYAAKKTAWALKLQKEAEEQGHLVVTGKKAKELIPHQYSSGYELRQHGLAKLDDAIPNDPQGTTWAKALAKTKLLEPTAGKPTVQKTLIEDPHHKGEIVQTITIADAAKALREQGYEVKLKSDPSPNSQSQADKKRIAKEKAQTAAENAFRGKLFDDLRKRIADDLSAGQMRTQLFLVLAQNAVDSYSHDNDAIKGLIARHAPELASFGTHEARAEAFAKKLQELGPDKHFLIIFELEMERERDVDIWAIKRGAKPDTMLRIAQVQGVNAETIRTKALKEHEAKVAEDAKAEAEKKAAQKKAAKPAAKKAPAEKKPAAPAAKPALEGPTRPQWQFPTPRSAA